jgi:hypothetical protein
VIDRLQQEINQIAYCRRIKSSSNPKILKKQTNMEEGRIIKAVVLDVSCLQENKIKKISMWRDFLCREYLGMST